MDEVAVRCESGRRALQKGDLLSAQSIYVEVLRRFPDNFEATMNLALINSALSRPEMAIALGRRAIEIMPESFEAWNNYGYVLSVNGKWEDGESGLRKALEIQDNPTTLHTLGMCLHQQGRWDEAIEVYDQELAYPLNDKQRVDAIDQRGLALLGAGRYTEGLIDNKIRWTVLVAHPLMHSTIPQWDGQPLAGKSICVLHEQGDGDTLQFVRFVPMLRERGTKHVMLSVPARMHRLFRGSGLADEIIGIQDVPDVDYICPMLTVPAHFNLNPTNIPSRRQYLWARAGGGSTEPDRKPGKMRIGLVWAGKPMYAADKWRSMDVENLLPIVQDNRFNFFGLQVGDRAADLWKTGLNAFVTDLSDKCTDWDATADIVEGLDAVISVDTAPAHLAGGMGKQTLLVIPEAGCWRWGDHDTTSTPWYPSMRIFRQQRQGDWAPVIREVHEHLDRQVGACNENAQSV